MAEEQKPVAVPAEETPATTTTETAAATDAAAPVEAAKEETAPAGMRHNSLPSTTQDKHRHDLLTIHLQPPRQQRSLPPRPPLLRPPPTLHQLLRRRRRRPSPSRTDNSSTRAATSPSMYHRRLGQRQLVGRVANHASGTSSTPRSSSGSALRPLTPRRCPRC